MTDNSQQKVTRELNPQGAKLTGREVDIIRLLARGLTNKEMAKSIRIAEGTVKIHLHNIYTKLGFNSRLELAVYALKNEIF
jgi:two-component system, NarL family, nitrate/nitrite response regulator NarL